MTRGYVEERARQALIKARGNRAEATRALVRLAGADQKLLAELTRPFLAAIATQAVDWTFRRVRGDQGARPAAPAPAGGGGTELSKAIASALGDGHVQGSLTSVRSPTRGVKRATAAAHGRSIRALAAAHKAHHRDGDE